MNRPIVLIFFLCILLGYRLQATPSCPSSVFWLEDFSLPNGTTSDTGPTAWTSKASGSGIYSVQNNQFKTSFNDQYEGVWTSGVIDISGKSNTILSVYLKSEIVGTGKSFETADYVRVYYKLNGGSETLVYGDVAGIGTTTVGTKDTTISAPLPAGSTVQIIIKTSNSDASERYYFDNVKLSGSTPPDITATGGVLACQSAVTLNVSSSISGVTYNWTGPNGFTSTSKNPTVSALGTYTATVTTPGGCTASQAVQVTSGATAFWLETFGQSNGTTSDNGTSAWSVQYAPSSSTFSVQNSEFEVSNSGLVGSTNESVWASGVIDISGKTNVSISAAIRSAVTGSGVMNTSGVYMDYIRFYYKLNGGAEVLFHENLAAINNHSTTNTLISSGSLNGASLQIIVRARATGSDEFYYFDNIQVWGGSALTGVASAGGVLTCVKTTVPLTGSSTMSGASYTWTGPNNFSSTAQDPTVSAPGIYTLTVSLGGCTGSDTALVTQDITPPAALTTTAVPVSAQLDCKNNSVTFTPGSSTPGVTYTWAGPNGALPSAGAVTVSATGTYTLTATNPANGCTAVASSVVTQNTTVPGGVTTTANPVTAQITCDHPSVTLTSNSTTPGVTYSWSDANGTVVGVGASVSVTAPGVYTVSVTDPGNGCITALPGSVTRNISVPIGLSASPQDIISCFTPMIDLQGRSSTPGVTFAWSGPGGYTANTADAQTDMPGNYTLTVTNPVNGCSASTPTVVQADTATPANVIASNNGPLNCINTSVTITSGSSTPGVDFTWVAPDNSFISGATAVVTVPGTYTIQVTNNSNGCFSQATTSVIKNTTGCPGSSTITRAAVSGRSEDFTTDAAAGFVYKAYPNPFSTTAFIEFASPVSSHVTVELYSSYGSLEKLLFNNTANANQLYKVQLNASGLSSGAHFCIIRNGDQLYSSRLILMK